jgi:UPF0489 domain
MHCVLDLDLDFFVWPIAHWADEKRRSRRDYHAASVDDVCGFLEDRCHLNPDDKILGREVVEHADAFTVWERWLCEGKLVAPFGVVHVDAHSDLGLGDAGWLYLLSEYLALSPEQRKNPHFASNALNSGNYLTFAIANRWVHSLTYVFPTALLTDVSEKKESEYSGRPADLMSIHFRNGDAATGIIELRRYTRKDAELVMMGRNIPPIHVESAVPFECVAADGFEFTGFTHMILAQSPQFTPATGRSTPSTHSRLFLVNVGIYPLHFSHSRNPNPPCAGQFPHSDHVFSTRTIRTHAHAKLHTRNYEYAKRKRLDAVSSVVSIVSNGTNIVG